MNKQQVNIVGFIQDVRTCVRKLDKKANVVLTGISNHYSTHCTKHSGNSYDKYDVRVTVFHGEKIAYAYTYYGIPTLKQFKQLAQAEYRVWLKKNSTALH